MTKPGLDIRQLTDAEFSQVVAVLGLARWHQGDGVYFVAWRGRVPVGHVYLTDGEVPEMQNLEVRPECRRQGIGAALIAAAETAAAARNAASVRLEVSVENATARRLYERCGYTLAAQPPRRVDGTVWIRTGPIEVHDELVAMDKHLS